MILVRKLERVKQYWRVEFVCGTRALGAARGDHETLGMSQLAKHTYLLDWRHTRAYAPMPSGNGIHIVMRDAVHPAGVTNQEYGAYRDRLMRDLEDLRDPHDGTRVVRHVWRREEIFQGPDVAVAPDLTLELEDGGLVSILDAESAVSRRLEPTGTHRPDGIFLASGPALRRGAQLPALSILDVAPLLLYSLDVAIPDDFGGQLPTAAILPASLAMRPPRRQAAARDATADEPAPRLNPAPVIDADAEAEIMRRLQALGYVE
jgi:hypothetical protein